MTAVTLLERVVRLASPELSAPELSRLTGASDSWVRRVLKECDLPHMRERDEDTRWTDAMSADLASMWADGLSLTAIGKRLGMTRNAVAGKARRLGLPVRQAPENFTRYRARLAAGE